MTKVFPRTLPSGQETPCLSLSLLLSYLLLLLLFFFLYLYGSLTADIFLLLLSVKVGEKELYLYAPFPSLILLKEFCLVSVVDSAPRCTVFF